MGDVVFRDDIVIYQVLARDTQAARVFMRRFKESLKRELAQEEILIIERTVRTI
jgi:hypothetical protein